MNTKRLFANKTNRSVVVELVADNVEYRVGEIRTKCCIYSRNNRLYVRHRGEFYAKFEETTAG